MEKKGIEMAYQLVDDFQNGKCLDKCPYCGGKAVLFAYDLNIPIGYENCNCYSKKNKFKRKVKAIISKMFVGGGEIDE